MTKIFTLKEKRGYSLNTEGTTKHPYEHKHNPRHRARAYSVLIACS